MHFIVDVMLIMFGESYNGKINNKVLGADNEVKVIMNEVVL